MSLCLRSVRSRLLSLLYIQQLAHLEHSTRRLDERLWILEHRPYRCDKDRTKFSTANDFTRTEGNYRKQHQLRSSTSFRSHHMHLTIMHCLQAWILQPSNKTPQREPRTPTEWTSLWVDGTFQTPPSGICIEKPCPLGYWSSSGGLCICGAGHPDLPFRVRHVMSLHVLSLIKRADDDAGFFFCGLHAWRVLVVRSSLDVTWLDFYRARI